MKILFWFILLSVLGAPLLRAADSLNLSECYRLAEQNYQFQKQKNLQHNISSNKIGTMDSKYLPVISLQGLAQYQSDVTKVNITPPVITLPNGVNFSIPPFNVPVPPKDQYRIGFNIDQLIWDGGLISGQKELETASEKLTERNLDVSSFQLKQRVNEVYFSILKLQQNLVTLNLSRGDLANRLATTKTQVESGDVLQSQADIIEAELVRTEQTIAEVSGNKSYAMAALGELINKPLDPESGLAFPAADNINNDTSAKNRPEYFVFEATKSQIDNSLNLTLSNYMPRFAAFGQAFYSKPGLNMFDPDFKPWYIVGVRMSWNIWNWNSSSRDEEIARLQKELVNTQEQTFITNMNINLQRYLADIKRLETLIDKDNKIIEIRQRIVEQAASQMENGVITATDYTTQFNAATVARMTLESHKIELLQAKVNYLTELGIK